MVDEMNVGTKLKEFGVSDPQLLFDYIETWKDEDLVRMFDRFERKFGSNIVQEEILPLRFKSIFSGELNGPLFNHAIEYQKVKLANWLMDRGADLNFGEEMDYFRPLELAVMHWFYGDDYAFLSYNDSINERGMLLMKMIDKGARFSEENRYDFLELMIEEYTQARQIYNLRLLSFIYSYQLYKKIADWDSIVSDMKYVWHNISQAGPDPDDFYVTHIVKPFGYTEIFENFVEA